MKKIILLTGIIFIFSKPFVLVAQCICPGPLYFQPYDSISNFTYIQNTPGSLSSTNGELWFNNIQGAGYHKIYDSIPGLSAISQGFTVSCKFFPVNGNSPGHMLMMFTETSEDPYTYQNPYPNTNNDALGVVFLSPDMPTGSTCCTNPTDPLNPWGFSVFAKKDTSLDHAVLLTGIHLPSLNSYYYLMLQRTNPALVTLSVFNDSLFTQHLPGSPLCFSIDSAIGPFNYFQQGVLTTASQYRVINAYLDDLKICSGTSCTILCPVPVAETMEENNLFEIKSNSSAGTITISLNNYLIKNKFLITITDAGGKKVFENYYSPGKNNIEINSSAFSDGIYFITLQTDNAVAAKKLVYSKE
ncbi:MAG TPA: T9SS type A sorting domain-containing protein [Bacteroidia bacterium]|nr:T9SS type A sorting domain-containing protein [Bacteroidia bacterium]